MRQRSGLFGPIDGITLMLYLALMFVGWLAIFTAQYNGEETKVFDLSRNYGKQILWIGISMIIFLFFQLFGTKVFSALSYPIYGGVIFLLIVVLTAGQIVSGSKSWINFGFFKLQPAEFAKFGTALALARYLNSSSGKFKDFRSYLISFAIIGLPLGLILLQGDVGSAMVYAGFIFVLNREGLSSWVIIMGIYIAVISVLALLFNPWILVGGLILLAGIVTFNAKKWERIKIAKLLSVVIICSTIYVNGVDVIFNKVLKNHHRSRINVLLGKEHDLSGAGYNVNQSKIAIGSGGFFGKGYLNGTQTRFNFVPELSTDFIFCTIGEEFGFIGTSIVIGLFLALFYRLLFLAERQRSIFSRVFIYSVCAILFMHMAINISMTVGLMPVIGIPLPFMSYGGSSLLSFSAMIATAVKLDSDRLLVFR